jgi:hypothetical protein
LEDCEEIPENDPWLKKWVSASDSYLRLLDEICAIIILTTLPFIRNRNTTIPKFAVYVWIQEPTKIMHLYIVITQNVKSSYTKVCKMF